MGWGMDKVGLPEEVAFRQRSQKGEEAMTRCAGVKMEPVGSSKKEAA